jgi:hypothetical protein
MPLQPVGLKTQHVDFRERDILALKLDMLIMNNLQFIKGLSPTNCQAQDHQDQDEHGQKARKLALTVHRVWAG